ncbi:hypothetical protein [Accumulibacter sp.]|nr:hypothetical protein [Accumulibacter sp.]
MPRTRIQAARKAEPVAVLSKTVTRLGLAHHRGAASSGDDEDRR